MKLKDFFLIELSIILIMSFGWVMNVLAVGHLAQTTDQITVMFVMRCIGVILVPLGAILGYLQ